MLLAFQKASLWWEWPWAENGKRSENENIKKHIKKTVVPINNLPSEFCTSGCCAGRHISCADILYFPYAVNSPWKRLFLWSTTNTGQSLYFVRVKISIMFYLLTWMGNSNVYFYWQLTKPEKYICYFLVYLQLHQPLAWEMQYIQCIFVNFSEVCTCVAVNFGLFFSFWNVIFWKGIHNRGYREGNGQSLLFCGKCFF